MYRENTKPLRIRPSLLEEDSGRDSVGIKTARELLKEARITAGSIIKEAEDSLKALQEAAQRDGYEQGCRRALDDALSSGALRIALVDSLTDELRGAVLTIAEKVLGEPLSLPPQLFYEQLRDALQLLSREPEIRLMVHPEDGESVRRLLEPLKESAGYGGVVVVSSDRALSKGSAALSANGCKIVAAPAEHAKRILEHLQQAPQLAEAIRADLVFRADAAMNLPDGSHRSLEET